MPKAWDEYCKRYIEYVPETGEILGAKSSPNIAWRVPYRIVYFNGKQIKVCHFAWFVMTGNWPTQIIDHKNRNSLDDSWNNLREIQPKYNARNKTKSSKNNKYIGVNFEDRKWRYYFTIEGRKYSKYGFNCQTKCALARDKHILSLNEKYTTLNLLDRHD